MAPPVAVILAFKQPLLAIGVRSVLAGRDDIQILAECSSLPGTVRAVKRYQPRVLVAGTGICDAQHSALETLARTAGETRIALFCTEHGDVPEHALLQGASAVLPPDSGPEHLIECIHAVSAGRRWRAPSKLLGNAGRARAMAPAATATVLSALSVRERQIAHAVATGKRNREIAEAFGISPGTVKLHLNRIYSKLGVNSRLALFKRLVSEANFPL
jgi:DNA-binding NarL/FixJ family response regulator